MVKAKRKESTFDISREDGGGWSWDGWTKGGEGFPIPTAKLGLWIFLGAVTMLFAAFTSAYIVRMSMPDWRNVPKPPILWFNTAVLILSSATIQWAWNSARKGNMNSLRNGLFATVALSSFFCYRTITRLATVSLSGCLLANEPRQQFLLLVDCCSRFTPSRRYHHFGLDHFKSMAQRIYASKFAEL